MAIHLLTVHWQNEEWIGPQLDYLQRAFTQKVRTYAFLNEIDPAAYRSRLNYISTEAIKSHATKLNLLSEVATASAEGDSDWLIFMDSDAFPIAPIEDYLAAQLARAPLLAIRRDENLMDPQPHPSFCATTVGFWKQLGGDWAPGYRWRNSRGQLVTDVGGNLLGLLRDRGIEWMPMLRSNRTNLHPVFFGIYDRLVYHHGAGSRIAASRADMEGFLQLPGPLQRVLKLTGVYDGWRERAARKNAALGRRLFRALSTDEQFYRVLGQ